MIGGQTRGVAHYQGRALCKPVRSADAGAGRGWQRGVLQSARVTALTLAITSASVAAPVIGEVVVNSPLLAVRGIEVKGTDVLTAAQVRRMAGLTEGMPVTAIAPRAAVAALLRSPRIAAATIERGWSGMVRVVISERRGVALIATAFDDSAATPLVVADDGVLFDPASPRETADLPFVTGLAQPRMRAGDRIAPARFRPIAQLLANLRRPDVALTPRISSIDLAAGDTLWLTTLQNASRVLLPRRPATVEDLVILRGILGDCDKQNLPAQLIDMTFTDMVVLHPADPQVLHRQARENRLEEQAIATEARARQAGLDSLAWVQAQAPADGLEPAGPLPGGATLLVAAGRTGAGHRTAGGVATPRHPGPTRDTQRGRGRDGHRPTSRLRTPGGASGPSTTSHRSLPSW